MTGRDKLLSEALTAAEKNHYNGVFLIPTGGGKGRLMIEIAKRLKPKSILYLCNSQELRDKMFIDEIHKWDAKYLLNIMDLQCYQTTYKWSGKHYDLVLADEFDAALTPEYSKVFLNNTFNHKILVSATLDDDKKRKARKIAPIIFEKKTKELISNKILNNVRYFFIKYDLTHEENDMYLYYNKQFKKLLDQYVDKNVKAKLEKLQIQRKQFLSSLKSSAEVTKWLIKLLSQKDEKILIFCGLSEQADRVCDNSYHSNNDNKQALEDFHSGKQKILSVVDKVTRGVNIADVKNIILESTGRSKTKITQKIGRGMRLEINDTLNVFFLVPHFSHPIYGKKPTIVEQWIIDSTKDMDLSKAQSIQYKK